MPWLERRIHLSGLQKKLCSYSFNENDGQAAKGRHQHAVRLEPKGKVGLGGGNAPVAAVAGTGKYAGRNERCVASDNVKHLGRHADIDLVAAPGLKVVAHKAAKAGLEIEAQHQIAHAWNQHAPDVAITVKLRREQARVDGIRVPQKRAAKRRQPRQPARIARKEREKKKEKKRKKEKR